MQPSVLVISSSSLGRAFGAFVAQIKPNSLLMVDPDSRRAELMNGRLFCLDFGSEFSVHQKMLIETVSSCLGQLSSLEQVKWVFCFEDMARSHELRDLRDQLLKFRGLRWVDCRPEANEVLSYSQYRLSLPWKVKERFLGRLRVEAKSGEVQFAGDEIAGAALKKLLIGHLTLQTAKRAVSGPFWKSWASQF